MTHLSRPSAVEGPQHVPTSVKSLRQPRVHLFAFWGHLFNKSNRDNLICSYRACAPKKLHNPKTRASRTNTRATMYVFRSRSESATSRLCRVTRDRPLADGAYLRLRSARSLPKKNKLNPPNKNGAVGSPISPAERGDADFRAPPKKIKLLFWHCECPRRKAPNTKNA